jgi:hypothetical protein
VRICEGFKRGFGGCGVRGKRGDGGEGGKLGGVVRGREREEIERREGGHAGEWGGGGGLSEGGRAGVKRNASIRRGT